MSPILSWNSLGSVQRQNSVDFGMLRRRPERMYSIIRGCCLLLAAVSLKIGRSVQEGKPVSLGSLTVKGIEQPFSHRLKYDVETIDRLKLSSSWTNM